MTENGKIDLNIGKLNLENNMNNLIYLGNFMSKIILCVDRKEKYLIGIDQHAVHERIRYEYFKMKYNI